MNSDQLPFFSESSSEELYSSDFGVDSLKDPGWLLGLLSLKGIGNKKALQLAIHFKTASRLTSATESEIEKVIGLNSTPFDKLIKLDSTQPDDVKILTYFDSAYPSGLRDLNDAPPLLWYRGEIPKNQSFAIVGTRNADDWGRRTTRLLAKVCGENNLAVISGLALGIDTEAHKGCLETSTPTVAILACDVRFPSPSTNSDLGNEIVDKGGCLIAEVPPGTKTESFALVARNRLQAAWSNGLIVTQCGIPSGTLHTVRFALELHRNLVVLEPPPQSQGSQYEGNWNLVKDFEFNPKILGGSKRFQSSIIGRKTGADIVLKSISQFEEFIKNA
jgi:DNA processing protein